MSRHKSKKHKKKTMHHGHVSSPPKSHKGPSQPQPVDPRRKKSLSEAEYDSHFIAHVIWFFVIAAILGAGYFFVIKKPSAEKNKMTDAITEVVGEKKDELLNRYPRGYTILTFQGKKVIPSSYNSLPIDLDIDWQRVELLRVKPEEQYENPAAIRIKIPNVTFSSRGIAGITLLKKFTRNAGEVVPLAKFGRNTLYLEVLEAYENQLICLVGFK